jgi:hypothetical protein
VPQDKGISDERLDQAEFFNAIRKQRPFVFSLAIAQLDPTATFPAAICNVRSTSSA